MLPAFPTSDYYEGSAPRPALVEGRPTPVSGSKLTCKLRVATIWFDNQRREEPMNRKGNFVSSLVFAVPTAFVMSLVLGILDDHLAWLVAFAIAIVPGVLSGWAAHYLYNRIAEKP